MAATPQNLRKHVKRSHPRPALVRARTLFPALRWARPGVNRRALSPSTPRSAALHVIRPSAPSSGAPSRSKRATGLRTFDTTLHLNTQNETGIRMKMSPSPESETVPGSESKAGTIFRLTAASFNVKDEGIRSVSTRAKLVKL
ncbi:hypothetical protein EVAR_34795_1 [Eumeta japonica]|uniref:Uncharacterized protein n=1 Tax=Eumeta variegata TaxID=151549 RepID=A0A4C1WCU8_EUMVA|nr:hypothetical protein EVAR_34795_1 [Eumeta japonica]